MQTTSNSKYKVTLSLEPSERDDVFVFRGTRSAKPFAAVVVGRDGIVDIASQGRLSEWEYRQLADAARKLMREALGVPPAAVPEAVV